MLSRTAEHLYWTGRYVERAENTARILDVSLRSTLKRDNTDDWESVVALVGEPTAFAAAHGTASLESVTRFAILDDTNPSSIHASFRAARENLRALRASISSESWESINSTWLQLRQIDDSALRERGPREVCEWIVQRSQLFQGISHGTALHDDAFHFLLLGTFLERADNTARLLSARYQRLQSADDSPSNAYYAWGAVLRAVSAFRSYHQVFHDVIEADRVAELLVLRRDMPRSLRYCAEQMLLHLDHLGKHRDLECQRLAGELYARLRFARMDKILEMGLPLFLAEIVEQLSHLGLQVSKDFLMRI
jgi:uncharacterized alpha-E superfamily protein